MAERAETMTERRRRLLLLSLLLIRQRRNKARQGHRGSQRGRLWKKPSLHIGSNLSMYFKHDEDPEEDVSVPSASRFFKPDDEFRREFRVSRQLFAHILQRIKPYLVSSAEHKAPSCRAPVLPREALAMALTRLGTKGEGFRVAKLFGRGDSTLTKWLDIVCRAILASFPEAISLPTADELKVLCKTMQARRGFPMAWGAEDGKYF